MFRSAQRGQDRDDELVQAMKEGDLDPVRTDNHGTRYGYRRLNCRCDRCRQWNADTIREWRQKQRAAMDARFCNEVVTERLRLLRGGDS